MENNNTSNKNRIKDNLIKKSDKYSKERLTSELNKVEQEGNLDNIKSKYILKKIFDNLNKGQLLRIINHNMKIQKRLNININDYKEFYEIYSTIELEIIPIKNISGTFNSFISSMNNMHIYFNDNKKEEIDKYDIIEDDKVEKIKVIIDYQEKSFSRLFHLCDCIESITFIKFYRNNINDMSFMFSGCSSLKEINFYNFNTDNVTDMKYMFYECKSLEKLELSKFNTDKVIDMQHMFDGCFSLKELKISNFNTENVENMNSMFKDCSSLKNIPVNNFNTRKVEDMGKMFFGCNGLKDLDLSKFDTNKVKIIGEMFVGCQKKLMKKIKAVYKNFRKAAFGENENININANSNHPEPFDNDMDDNIYYF